MFEKIAYFFAEILPAICSKPNQWQEFGTKIRLEMDNSTQALTLAQQANQAVFAMQVKQMSNEQLQDLAIQMNEALMIQKNACSTLLKKQWGI